MVRPYHSPSSIALAERCERAWYHAYVDGLRSPPTVATELGGQVHRVFEAYYRKLKGAQAPDWASRAGQIATSALHLLPDPRAVEAYPEEAIGGPWCGDSRVLLREDGDTVTFGKDGCRDDSKPGRAIIVDGCRYAGFRDLVVSGDDDDWGAIGANHAIRHEFLLVDYKTSSNIHKYGKPREVLEKDFAANLYAYDVALQFEIDTVPCRWPYISTGSRREAVPTDFTIRADDAYEVIRARTPLVRRIDAFNRPEDAVCNTAACADYGGCPYHMSKGGPCRAQRNVSAFILARSKGTDNMALSEETKAKFAKLRVLKEAEPTVAPTEPPPPPGEDEPAEGPAPTDEETAAPEPTRDTLPPTPVAVPAPKRAAAKPAVKSALTQPQQPVSNSGLVVVAELCAEVTAAQAAVDEILSRASGLAEAEAKRDAAIEALRKALA